MVHGTAMAFYYTYVLYSFHDKKQYIGYTNDLRRRIKEHKDKKVVSTRNKKEIRLIYYEAYLNKYDAIKREKYFKSDKGKKSLRLMLKNYWEGCRSGQVTRP